MKLLLQRVSSASVSIQGILLGSIQRGVVIFVAIGRHDTEATVHWAVHKIINLRIFPDQKGKMNFSLQDINGALLVISQFTLYGNCSKGHRPSYDQAAPAKLANSLYTFLVQELEQTGLQVETGRFQAMMQVEIHNDGPVTLLVEK